MKCFKCHKEAVLFQRYSGRHLCTDHLCIDVETRAKRVIRQNRWLVSGDRIGVVMGMRHSSALWIFLSRLLGNRNDTRIVPLPCIRAERNGDRGWAHAFFSGVPSADVTRIALADCAEDLAEQALKSIMSGDADFFLSQHRASGTPVMQPLREIPHEELDLYARRYRDLVCMPEDADEFPEPESPFDCAVRSFLLSYTSSHPSTPHALRRYLDTLRDMSGAS